MVKRGSRILHVWLAVSSAGWEASAARRGDKRQPWKPRGKDRTNAPARCNADISSERICEEVRRAGVSSRKICLQDFNSEADQSSQNDRASAAASLYGRQTSVKAKTERNEPNDVLEVAAPVTPGHAELFPEWIEKDLIQNQVLLRDIQIHVWVSLVVDDISRAFVEQVQGSIALAFRYSGCCFCVQVWKCRSTCVAVSSRP